MSCLITLPAEVQKSIITSLDYASLCQLRSTSRYFYNFLTEHEIHDIFMNIEIERGEYVNNPKDGQKCSECAGHCDATAVQVKATERKVKLAVMEVKSATEKLLPANKHLATTQTTLSNAKAAVRTTKVNKEKKEKRVKVTEAVEQVKVAKDEAKSALQDFHSAMIANAHITTESLDSARTCTSCKRRYNGYMAPGITLLNIASSRYWILVKACSRSCHNRRQGWEPKFQAMHMDGKICKVCWKGTSRGTSGIQRRKVFVEEYGYWLRETWLAEGKAIMSKSKLLANKSFEEIGKEKEEADAAKELKELTTMKVEADAESS